MGHAWQRKMHTEFFGGKKPTGSVGRPRWGWQDYIKWV